jgi:hypothetical protein
VVDSYGRFWNFWTIGQFWICWTILILDNLGIVVHLIESMTGQVWLRVELSDKYRGMASKRPGSGDVMCLFPTQDGKQRLDLEQGSDTFFLKYTTLYGFNRS